MFISCSESDKAKGPDNFLIDLNQKGYEKIIRSKDELIVVGFFRDKDQMNKKYMDIMNLTASTLKDSIIFAHIDVDENYRFAKETGIECVPTYKFIKNGKVIRSLNGTLDSLQLDLVISDIVISDRTSEPENLYAND